MKQQIMDAVVGSCEETQEQLSDRMEGQLRGLRRLRVSMHLIGCDRCRAVLRSLIRTVEHVHELGRVDFAPSPDGSVTDRVIERIRHERR
jgi:predicted anti-sigma-YlaC factor YlaD